MAVETPTSILRNVWWRCLAAILLLWLALLVGAATQGAGLQEKSGGSGPARASVPSGT